MLFTNKHVWAIALLIVPFSVQSAVNEAVTGSASTIIAKSSSSYASGSSTFLTSSTAKQCPPSATKRATTSTTTTSTKTITTTYTTTTSPTSYVTTLSETVRSDVTIVHGSTSTYYRTTSTTVISTLPVSKTVTSPTPCGFTPIALEPAYTARRIYITSVVTWTESSAIYKPVGTTYTDYDRPDIVYPYTSYSTYYSTPVKGITTTIKYTVTTSSATHTAYKACATDNLVGKYPNGRAMDGLNVDQNKYTYKVYNSGANPETCCSFCHARPTDCVGSMYAVGGFTDDEDFSGDCAIFIAINTTSTVCDPRQQAGTFGQTDSEDSGAYTNVYEVLSNGPCGQFVPGNDYF